MANNRETKIERSQRKWINYLLAEYAEVAVQIKDIWETVNLIRKDLDVLKQRLDEDDKRREEERLHNQG